MIQCDPNAIREAVRPLLDDLRVSIILIVGAWGLITWVSVWSLSWAIGADVIRET